MTIKIPKICSDLTKQIDFVSKVFNKKAKGEYGKTVNAIYFDEKAKRIVATDGHRMHYADLDDDSMAVVMGAGMVEGTYKIIASTKNEIILEKDDATFPNYKAILPDITAAVHTAELKVSDTLFNKCDLLTMLYNLPEKTCYNLDFFRDLIVKKDCIVYNVYWYGKEDAIMFQSKEAPIVICLMMPLNDGR